MSSNLRLKRGGFPVACDTPHGTKIIGVAQDEPDAHVQLLRYCKPMGLVVVTAKLHDIQVGDTMARAWFPGITFERTTQRQLTHQGDA